MSRPVAAAPFLANREPHPGRNLLRAQKIFMRGVFQAAAFERHQALVSAHVRPLIDGHREMALAEQRAGVLTGLEPLRVEARIGAQAIRRLEVDDQERHRAIGLGLQNETAVEFQRRAEQRREHDRLAEQLADRPADNHAWSGCRRARARAGSGGRADRAQRPRTAAPRRRPERPTAREPAPRSRFSCRGILKPWRFIWGRRGQSGRGSRAGYGHCEHQRSNPASRSFRGARQREPESRDDGGRCDGPSFAPPQRS